MPWPLEKATPSSVEGVEHKRTLNPSVSARQTGARGRGVVAAWWSGKQGVLELLVVVEIVAFEEEPGDHLGVAAPSIGLEDLQLLERPVPRDREVGYGPVQPLGKARRHGLVVGHIPSFDI